MKRIIIKTKTKMIENTKVLLFIILIFVPIALSINLWAKGITDEFLKQNKDE